MKFISVKDYCKLMENLGTPVTRQENLMQRKDQKMHG